MRKLVTLFVLVLVALGSAQDAGRQGIIDAVFVNRLSEQQDQYFDNGEFPKIIESLKVGYEMNPTDFDIATSLGWMLENVERWDEALATYVRFRRENLHLDPDAAFPEANFYFTRRNFSKVVSLLEPTIKRTPHGNSYRILAHAYDRMGMLKESLRVWNALVKVAPADLTAIRNRDKIADKIKKAG